MIETIDIYWLAGLLEGEGCFSCSDNNGYPCPVVQVAMSDEDIIQRAAAILGGGGKVRVRLNPKGTFEHKKPIYVFRTTGQEAIEWMFTLYSLMGERRRAKIEEIIITWKTNNDENRALEMIRKKLEKSGYSLSELFREGGGSSK